MSVVISTNGIASPRTTTSSHRLAIAGTATLPSRTVIILVPLRSHGPVARSIRSLSTIKIESPTSFSENSSSSSVHHEFIETETAPIPVIAVNAIAHSGRLRIEIPTWSPGLMPYV